MVTALADITRIWKDQPPVILETNIVKNILNEIDLLELECSDPLTEQKGKRG